MDTTATGASHRHYSSTDSMDGSTYSNHSQQGSDSNESTNSRRRTSSQLSRQQSSSADPLQFIKGKTATDLAQKAEVQMRVAAESKKVTVDIKSQEEEPVDWLANLSTWKNRRKSQSERSYQLKEDLEQMEKEKEGEQTSNLTTKTFSQMQDERERRKSTSRHFYPIHDADGEDDIFSFQQDKKTDKPIEEPITMMMKPKAEIAPWARDNSEDKNKSDTTKKQDEEEEDSESDNDDVNNNDKDINAEPPNDYSNSFQSRISPKSSYSWKNQSSNGSRENSTDTIQRSHILQQRSAPVHSYQPNDKLMKNENFKASGTNVGPRTQSKIGNIMQNFQQLQNKTASPKQGYNEKINLSSLKKSFEQFNVDSNLDKPQDVRPSNRWNHNNRVEEEDKEAPSDPAPSDQKLKQIEKAIKMSQKPNNDKGFGFFLTGGADQGRPLSVSKVALGSAADLGDLKVKDEILRVNQTDVAGKTAGEVGDVIGKAVGKGCIEIRVRRVCDEDEFEGDEEEDMTSSSDEGEEDLTKPQQQQTSSFAAYQDPEPVEEPVIEAVVKDRSKITLLAPFVDYTDSYLSSSKPNEVESTNSEKKEDDEDDGPPAILRKWQRQRQRAEYTFENSPSPISQTPLYKKISLNASYPLQDSSEKNENSQENVEPSKGSWDERMDEWTNKHDQIRQPDPLDPSSHSTDDQQANFESRQEEMRKKYEGSLNLADEKAEEQSRQEQSFLQPELDKARILEERRQERRNRIQESAVAAVSSQPSQITASSSLPLPSSFIPSFSSSSSSKDGPQTQRRVESNTYSANQPNSHVTSMTFDISDKNRGRRDFAVTNPASYSNPTSYSLPKQQGVIIIDPRNQADQRQNTNPVEFQIKLAPKQALDNNSAEFLEAERERIRQEEMKKVDEERQKTQREWESKQEEMRKFEEKKRQIEQEEELLRQEREQFRREQEEFKILQMQQQQQKPQYQDDHQQQQLQPQQQIKQHHQSQQHSFQPSHSLHQNLYPDTQQYQNYHQLYHQTTQPSQQQQPQPLMSTLTASQSQPQFSPSSPSHNQSTSYREQPSSKHSTISSQSMDRNKSKDIRPLKPTSSTSYSKVNSQFNSSSQAPIYSNAPTRQDEPSTRHDREVSPAKGGRFSREDILAANRKAAPEPESSSKFYENNSQPYHQNNAGPVTRESSSTGQAHPLNSAPRARLRNDSEWQDPSRAQNHEQLRRAAGREAATATTPRRSAFGNTQEHWLVEEAERRRMAESDSHLKGQSQVNRGPSPYLGPIKGQVDDASNRWRDGNSDSPSMPHAIRQTLLQKTATARGSDGNSVQGELTAHHLIPQHQQQHSPSIPQQQRHSPRSISPQTSNAYYQQPQQLQQHRGPAHFPTDLQKYNPNPVHQIQQGPPTTLQRTPPPLHHSRNHAPAHAGENGLPLNGSQLCSHCNQELGFGAAMVIESLGIFFHIQCFRCCVCHASLGTGAQGADVRVRMNKLHCPNCYSNDEGNSRLQAIYQSRRIWIKV